MINLTACVGSFVKEYRYLPSLNGLSSAWWYLVKLLLLCDEMDLLGLTQKCRLVRSKALTVCHLNWMKHILTDAKVLVLVRSSWNLKINRLVHSLVSGWIWANTLVFSLNFWSRVWTYFISLFTRFRSSLGSVRISIVKLLATCR